MPGLKKILSCIFLVIVFLFCNGQIKQDIIISNSIKSISDSASNLHIKNIIVKGNSITKEYIILREIQFKKGDSILISSLKNELVQARQQVYNTTLFSEVHFECVLLGKADVIIIVDVKERWYIYPVPEFKIGGIRNFNEWAKTYHASLQYINYGIKFTDYNTTGRKDELNIVAVSGFSREFSLTYKAPYSNSKLTNGFSVSAGYAQLKKIPYATTYSDSLLTYTSDSLSSKFVGSTFYANAGYSIRKGFFSRHSFHATFYRISITDSILLPKNNPNYFSLNTNTVNILELAYTYRYSNVNNVSYSTKGTTLFAVLAKKGLGLSGGINALTLEAGYNKYYDYGKNWYSSFQLYGKLRLPFTQAFINQQALGYNDSYLPGQEYLVINGVATGLIKSTLKYKILDIKIPLHFKIKSLSYIPITIYAKTYADAGYTFNKQEFLTALNNKFLYTGGFGIDIVTFYDLNFRLEYSFNQLNKNGLFLHAQTGF